MPGGRKVDFDKAVWVIPAGRMKAGKEHRVPLSDRAVAILTGLEEVRTGDFVFPGTAHGKPLTEMAMARQLRRMKADDITVHGFRSTFRDWASETTRFRTRSVSRRWRILSANKTEAAYRRGDLFEEASKAHGRVGGLLRAEGDSSNIVPISRRPVS